MASYVTTLINDINPDNNQTGVSLDTAITISFAEAMDINSLTKETILFTKGSRSISADYIIGNVNKELKIIPHLPLIADQTYRIEVLSKEHGPKTLFGNLTSRSYTFYFTTKEEDKPEEPDVPEDPGFPEEPPIEPETPWEDPLFHSLELIDSYPKEGDLVSDLSSVVLSFDQEVDPEETAPFVYLREKAISPLLSKLNNANKLLFSANEESNKETVVLNVLGEVKQGTAYELVLKDGISAALNPELALSKEHVIPFQLQWELFYSSVESVKLLLGVFKDIYTDAEIATMIHQESLATYQMMSMKDDFDPLLWDKKTPYAASQYVLYRTAYQAILGQVIETSSGMKQSIKLADLSVGESSSVSSQITDLMGLFQAEMDKWWKLLNGLEEDVDGTYRPKLSKTTGSATRGSTDYPYPDWMKRVPYKDLGG